MNGRRGGIRTRDPLHPMQVRYQAALHADKPLIIASVDRASALDTQQKANFAQLAHHGFELIGADPAPIARGAHG